MAGAVSRVISGSLELPALFAPDRDASRRFLENIRNPNTRRAYASAAAEFANWCEAAEIRELRDIEPVHIAAHIESLQKRLAAPSVKQHLAAVRMLFDVRLACGRPGDRRQSSQPGAWPEAFVKKGKTAVLSAEEARRLLDSIDPSSRVGLRDRALIALMVYTFARISAALKMSAEDVYTQQRRS